MSFFSLPEEIQFQKKETTSNRRAASIGLTLLCLLFLFPFPDQIAQDWGFKMVSAFSASTLAFYIVTGVFEWIEGLTRLHRLALANQELQQTKGPKN